jgi:hypothetical protein
MVRSSIPSALVLMLAGGEMSLIAIVPAFAQYSYDPGNADEQAGAGIRYFGSAKDTNGMLVPGATIVVSNEQSRFVFLTDETGRFRGRLPPDLVRDKVTIKCWKQGFRFVQVAKRAGPRSVKPTVQVDCMLQKVDRRIE